MRHHAPFVKSDGCLKGDINLNPRMRDPLPARPRESVAPHGQTDVRKSLF
jgi:hypothetical protein